ncbi:MAG: TonB-dependent receptor [Bacteroidota bacterium]
MLLLCICFLNKVNAQTTDTSGHILNEIVISANKQELLQASRKSTSIDSFTMARYQTSSLTDLLSAQSAIHVKSYGAGNIASTSIRGGNASQTAILWNGLNINSPGLGMYDLSLIPISLFDDVSLEYGGGSTLWGSGAVGGAVHLNSKPIFNRGFHTKLNMSVGSFGTQKISTGLLLSYKKITSSTKIYYVSSLNNYSYKDTLDRDHPDKSLINSDYIMKGLMQEISLFVNPYQKMSVRLWYNYAFRNLPTNFFVTNTRNQTDENIKLNADWNYAKYRFKSIIRGAYFKDANEYNDSLRKTHSNNNTHTIIAENDNIYQFKQHTFNVGVNFTLYQLQSINKEDEGHNSSSNQLQKLAFFAAYKLLAFNSRLNYNVSVRKEFTNLTNIPFTGNTGIRYKLIKHIAVKINASSAYRQPTLYDLYWRPGGNPYLKPEESYDFEGGLEYEYSSKGFSLVVEGTYFNRRTKNWITWLPSDKGYVSPRNIAEVYSRGTETKTEMSYMNKDFLAKLIINTSYVLSTYSKNEQENDNSIGRQLIFTPRYTGQGSILINYKKMSVLFNQNYTGYRFTSSDNTSWLNPYYIANLKCGYQYTFGNVNMEIFGSINNLFNKNYLVIANNPMPLRNYEIGLTMNYHKQKKKTENKNTL